MERLSLIPSYEATQSKELFAWVKAHWKDYFVPEDLLVIWGYDTGIEKIHMSRSTLRRVESRLHSKKPIKRVFNAGPPMELSSKRRMA